MKIWKRRMALVLALVLLLSTGAMAAGAKYSSWFAPYYKEMQALGILPASFTTGDLTATITRGSMSSSAPTILQIQRTKTSSRRMNTAS